MHSPEDYKRKFQWLLRLTSYLWLNVILLVIGILLSFFTQGWIQGIGTSLVAAAIVGFLFLYQLKLDRQFDDSRKLYEEYGIISVIPERSNKQYYSEHLDRCRYQLDMIGHSFSRFYNDLGKDFLPKLSARGVQIRMLVLDPASFFVKVREKEDTSPERTDLPAEILKAVQCYRGLNLKNLRIRYYQSTPTINYLRIDDTIFAGSYFVGLPSGQKPTLMLRANQELSQAYQEHFDFVWNNCSRDV